MVLLREICDKNVFYLYRVTQTQDHHHLIILEVQMILHTVNSAIIDKHLQDHLISELKESLHSSVKFFISLYLVLKDSRK